jgi:hypothetical protein
MFRNPGDSNLHGLQGGPTYYSRLGGRSETRNAALRFQIAAGEKNEPIPSSPHRVGARPNILELGCSITEATQALGCAASIELAVQVKREISELWWKIDRPPYTDLFNEHLTSVRLWKSVRILRAVDEELQKLRRSSAPVLT